MRSGRLLIIFLILFCMLIPIGCWDLADINDHIFILGLGIDPDEEEGLFRFTFHYANPRGEESDQSSDKMTYVNSTIRSSSLPLAVRELIRNSDSEANFEHMQALVLGVDYLEKLSFDDIDMLFRMASVRRKCVVVASDIPASDLLSMKFSGMSTAVLISRLSNHYSASDSKVLSGFSLTSLYSKKKNNSSFYLFTLGAVENSNYTAVSSTDQKQNKDISIIVTGLTSYKNCIYAGRLGYTELETIRLLSNRQTEGIVSITSDNGDDICFQIASSKCSKACKIENNKPVFTIKLKADCLLLDSGNNNITGKKTLIEEALRENIAHIISLGKLKYGAELLGLESAMRKDCSEWYQNNPDYFSNDFWAAQIEVDIDCTISSMGIIE